MYYETIQRPKPRNHSFISADSIQCRDVYLLSTLTGPTADKPYQDKQFLYFPSCSRAPACLYPESYKDIAITNP